MQRAMFISRRARFSCTILPATGWILSKCRSDLCSCCLAARTDTRSSSSLIVLCIRPRHGQKGNEAGRLRSVGTALGGVRQNVGIFAPGGFAAFTEVAISNDHRHPRRLRRDDMGMPDGLSDASGNQIHLLLAWFF